MQPLTHFLLRNLQAPHGGEEGEEEEAAIDGLFVAIINKKNGERNRGGGWDLYIYIIINT